MKKIILILTLLFSLLSYSQGSSVSDNAQKTISTSYSTLPGDRGKKLLITTGTITLDDTSLKSTHWFNFLNTSGGDKTISLGTAQETVQWGTGAIPTLEDGYYGYAELVSDNTWSVIIGQESAIGDFLPIDMNNKSVSSYTTTNADAGYFLTVTSGDVTLDAISLDDGFNQVIFNTSGANINITTTDTNEGNNNAIPDGYFATYVWDGSSWYISTPTSGSSYTFSSPLSESGGTVSLNQTNIANLDATQTFTGANTFNGFASFGTGIEIEDDITIRWYNTSSAERFKMYYRTSTSMMNFIATTETDFTTNNYDFNFITGTGGVTIDNDLQVDGDPSTGDHVGNRDYNDARYAELSTSNTFTGSNSFSEGISISSETTGSGGTITLFDETDTKYSSIKQIGTGGYDLHFQTADANSDYVFYQSNGTTSSLTIDETGDATFAGTVGGDDATSTSHFMTLGQLNDDKWVTAPSSATSSGTAGQMAYDSSYIYICTATDTWKRVAITTW